MGSDLRLCRRLEEVSLADRTCCRARYRSGDLPNRPRRRPHGGRSEVRRFAFFLCMGFTLEYLHSGRKVTELKDFSMKIGNYDALDYFSDGSLYILDSPGVCALCVLPLLPPDFPLALSGAHQCPRPRHTDNVRSPRRRHLPSPGAGPPQQVLFMPSRVLPIRHARRTTSLHIGGPTVRVSQP